MNGRDQPREQIDIEKVIENSLPDSDPLEDYSVRDLVTALNLTSKKDLAETITELGDDQSIDELWEALTQAIKGLKKFKLHQMIQIIESCNVTHKH